jgi:serine/threonine protein kinase
MYMNGSLPTNLLLDNRYLILAKIGEGGYGTVYKARDMRKHGRIVSIKEINMSALSVQEKIEVTDTFNREIMLLSELRHKSLPRVHDQFTDPEHWYIVMDYIEGETLEHVLARSPGGRLPVQQVIRIGIALCDVLSYLHDQDPAIIFRDVKPSNIMLTPWGEIYLIDFGIARRYRPGKLRDTEPLGSPGYAAPEQYGRTQTTPRTDIYGLGATLQTLLTGREPLEIRTQGLPSNVYIPWSLQALLTQMMDPIADQRPTSMAEVKEALTSYLIIQKRFQVFAPVMAYLSLVLTGFDDSPLLVPYLLLAAAFIAGYCLYQVVRAWRTTPTRHLSSYAIMLIVKNQFCSIWLQLCTLTVSISLFYGILTYPAHPQAHNLTFWISAAVYTSIIARFFFKWFKSWHAQQRSQRSSVSRSQTLPPQQIHNRT